MSTKHNHGGTEAKANFKDNTEDPFEGNFEDEGKVEKMQNMMRVFTHDLRNPLLNIQALVHELDLSERESGRNNPEMAETLDMLKESANRMDDMIVAANEMYHCMFDELEIEDVDMHDMFLRCFANLKLAEENIKLTCPAMPIVRADPLVAQRIVLELLSNAKKAMSANLTDIPCSIRVSTLTEKDMVWFCVEDTGCGFIEDEMDYVFEVSFKGQRFEYGAGLGLARAQAWVEHHGGNINIESIAEHAVIGFSLPQK
ncbi:MAG: HAMP domain-containing sensor histidine kinase [Ghiorsea sp.]